MKWTGKEVPCFPETQNSAIFLQTRSATHFDRRNAPARAVGGANWALPLNLRRRNGRQRRGMPVFRPLLTSSVAL